MDVIALDFSKAFDIVRHATLMDMMAQLTLPDTTGLETFSIVTPTVLDLQVKYLLLLELQLALYKVPVLVLHPTLFNAADLRPKHGGNVITKFADDTYLIIPARNSHTRGDEVSHAKSWASNNNLQLNCSKSHEIVFRSRRLRGKADQPAPPSLDIKCVDKLTILGVVVNSNLTATDHVNSLLASCFHWCKNYKNRPKMREL